MTHKEIERIKATACNMLNCENCPFLNAVTITGCDVSLPICDHISQCDEYSCDNIQELSAMIIQAMFFADIETLEFIDRNRDYNTNALIGDIVGRFKSPILH